MPRVTGEQMAEQVSNWLNDFGVDQKGFVERMLREHRTLQQSLTRLCLRWLYTLAKAECYDARNEASVLAARKVVAALGEHGDKLPCI